MLWVLISPLVWTVPGMPDFVTLTLVGNSLQVVLIPFIAGGLWWITASPPLHRRPVPQPLVGKRRDGGGVRAGAVGRLRIRSSSRSASSCAASDPCRT